jgi:hypothetical protein
MARAVFHSRRSRRLAGNREMLDLNCREESVQTTAR